MRIASIDIGTNTILLLIADVDENGIQKILQDEQVIARLGKGVDADGIINDDTFIRAENYLKAYKATCNEYSVNKIVAVGTSALRDAKNRNEFCKYIYNKVGISIEVISGDEEAQWTYRGGISEFHGRSELFSVIDIGGGSTEIITGDAIRITSKTSINIGSVRLTERILKGSPPETSSIIEAHEYISSLIPHNVIMNISSTFVIGVAGTLTTLASLHQQLPNYIPEKVNGYTLQYEDVCSMFALLKDKTLEQIKLYPQISSGRADIILAGILILAGIMEKANLHNITVSDRGLRYGMLYREIKNIFNENEL
jgi:exopolyphosphatase / guanosine-5'-triphosphate,3'-diphosphate pyrophosphatase